MKLSNADRKTLSNMANGSKMRCWNGAEFVIEWHTGVVPSRVFKKLRDAEYITGDGHTYTITPAGIAVLEESE